jgi:hypothetical protein
MGKGQKWPWRAFQQEPDVLDTEPFRFALDVCQVLPRPSRRQDRVVALKTPNDEGKEVAVCVRLEKILGVYGTFVFLRTGPPQVPVLWLVKSLASSEVWLDLLKRRGATRSSPLGAEGIELVDSGDGRLHSTERRNPS